MLGRKLKGRRPDQIIGNQAKEKEMVKTYQRNHLSWKRGHVEGAVSEKPTKKKKGGGEVGREGNPLVQKEDWGERQSSQG